VRLSSVNAPAPSCPPLQVGMSELTAKDRSPWEHKEAMYVHVNRDTRQKRNGVLETCPA